MADSTRGAAPTRLTWLDRLVASVDPQRGLKRLAARTALAHYEAARPSTQRKWRTTSGEPNHLPGMSAVALRNHARYLERNHDIARGIVSTLVHNVVGPAGIGVEFQPRRRDGTIHSQYAAALGTAWKDWARRPEVTWKLHWAAAQRLQARTWFRDGEAFGQRIVGPVPGLDHGTRVPYSIELIEPDLVPLDFDDEARRIRQGCERNAWGRALAWHVYKGHPEDAGTWRGVRPQAETKRVPAERMLHLAHCDRIGQIRGVSAFASVITRLEDIKDYEESERVAAKVAAMITGFVKRHHPDGYDPKGMETDEEGNLKPRDLRMQPGMIIDSLAVGEEIGLLAANRPNPNLALFRAGQLRALAGGVLASYSSIARDYNGTYSAQRQELVEQWVHYAVLSDDFASGMVLPVVQDFVVAADLSGVAPTPRDLLEGTADDVLLVYPSMPWIEPMREMSAWLLAVQAGFASEYEVMRKRGVNPADLLAQVMEWRGKTKAADLTFSSDAATQTQTSTVAAAEAGLAPSSGQADGGNAAAA